MANCGVCNHRNVCRCFPNPEEYCSDYEPERPQGEWLTEPHSMIMHCSNCGAEENKNKLHSAKYCCECGASMSANDRQVTGKLNSEIEKSKSEIVPDYRDGWKLKEGDEK